MLIEICPRERYSKKCFGEPYDGSDVAEVGRGGSNLCRSRRLSNESSTVSRQGDIAHSPEGDLLAALLFIVLGLPPKTQLKFGFC